MSDLVLVELASTEVAQIAFANATSTVDVSPTNPLLIAAVSTTAQVDILILPATSGISLSLSVQPSIWLELAPILRGDKGDKGDKGDSVKGDKGDKGDSGDVTAALQALADSSTRAAASALSSKDSAAVLAEAAAQSATSAATSKIAAETLEAMARDAQAAASTAAEIAGAAAAKATAKAAESSTSAATAGAAADTATAKAGEASTSATAAKNAATAAASSSASAEVSATHAAESAATALQAAQNSQITEYTTEPQNVLPDTAYLLRTDPQMPGVLNGFAGAMPLAMPDQPPSYKLKIKTQSGLLIEFNTAEHDDDKVPEYTDRDMPAAALGDHWITKTSAQAGGVLGGFMGAMPVTSQDIPERFDAKWFTSSGVRSVRIS